MPDALRTGQFVKSPDGLGFGKVQRVDGNTTVVSFFQSIDRSIQRCYPTRDLSHAYLSAQTRVYSRLPDSDRWWIGRVIDRVVSTGELTYEIRLPNQRTIDMAESNLETRCLLPVDDPTDVLACGGIESQFVHDRRMAVMHALLRFRAVGHGLTGLLSAGVELIPHQVAAVRRVLEDPIQRYLLADEVGMGKTIEAGLVLTQRWAEGRRRVLVVAPASLRKQWVQELAEKFFLPAVILETKSFNAAVKAGAANPFEGGTDDRAVVVCSYQFAARKAEELGAVRWDLAILDEVHRLRNVFKPGAKIATAIRNALSTTPKLLLTATPLQNSLMELYGLVSVIDEHHFGDATSFRAQYSRLADGGRFDDLKARLEPVCHRTLRRQVVEYVSYTNRVPITQEFLPSPEEQALYDMVSDYLRRPALQALPASQRP